MRKLLILGMLSFVWGCSLEIPVMEPIPSEWDETFQSWTEVEFWNWIFYDTVFIPDPGTFDYWRSPASFLRDQGGDCEDYVVMAMFFFHEYLGYDKYRLKIVMGTHLPSYSSHAALVIDGIVIEAQTGRFMKMDEFIPLAQADYDWVMERVLRDQER